MAKSKNISYLPPLLPAKAGERYISEICNPPHHICCLGLPEEEGKLVEMEDISRVYKLFWDVKRSTQYLTEYQSQYMFNEMPTGEGDEGDTSAMMA
ncbi:unnamed protein product [Ilex paraguariensis]|uniref:Uncharacterized protein n=1 Tax=Ilex paraguariensis TaxID=185542 RepID=A0ABC8R832_9AQUA